MGGGNEAVQLGNIACYSFVFAATKLAASFPPNHPVIAAGTITVAGVTSFRCHESTKAPVMAATAIQKDLLRYLSMCVVLASVNQ